MKQNLKLYFLRFKNSQFLKRVRPLRGKKSGFRPRFSYTHSNASVGMGIFVLLAVGLLALVAGGNGAFAKGTPTPTTKAVPNSTNTEAKPEASLGIVALVNDQVITSTEVGDRARFIISTAKLSDTPETIQRLVPQVTRQLIDETLQLQEATRLGVSISDAKVDTAIEDVAVSRGGTSDILYQQLAESGVSPDTFKDQVRAQLAWGQVVSKAIRSKVKVSEEEIEQARLQNEAATGTDNTELQLVSLVLPVDKPERDLEVKTLAEKLVNDLINGASFEDVAKQFGSSNAPEPIWVPISQMDPNMAKALEKAVPGAVSKPARTENGYVIVKLLNRRSLSSAQTNDSEMLIKDILLKLKNDDSTDSAKLSLDIAREVARYPGDCKDDKVAGIQGLEDVDMVVQFVNARYSELAPVVQQLVQNLSVGAVSEPFATPDGIRMMMLCERIDAPPELAEKELTYTKLMNSKLELETQKYMRNLRRDAFIEFRGK